MKTSTIVAVALAVTAIAAIPVAGLAATDGQPGADQVENSTENGNASVAPGERLSGVVGVQQAELEGEVDRRAFGLQIARAAGNDSRADVVREQSHSIERRLAELEQRKQTLDRARENGSMNEGQYRAEVAEMAARTETVRDLAGRTENATRGMPAELLESKGINVSSIQRLRKHASNMMGPEVAEIARGITGPGASPVDRGPHGPDSGPQGPADGNHGPDSGPQGPTDGHHGPDERGTHTATPADGPTGTPMHGGDGSQRGDRGGPGGR
jgi:hypothetical protein